MKINELIAMAKGQPIGNKPSSKVYRLQNGQPELIADIQAPAPHRIYCILDNWQPVDGWHEGRQQAQQFIQAHERGALGTGWLHFVGSLEQAHRMSSLFNSL